MAERRMTGTINLRAARKAKARAAAAAQAAENRIRHGRTLPERQADEREAALAAKRLDQIKRSDG